MALSPVGSMCSRILRHPAEFEFGRLARPPTQPKHWLGRKNGASSGSAPFVGHFRTEEDQDPAGPGNAASPNCSRASSEKLTWKTVPWGCEASRAGFSASWAAQRMGAWAARAARSTGIRSRSGMYLMLARRLSSTIAGR